jgi:hypothetical protein
MKSPEHADGGDRGPSKLGRDVLGDTGETQDVDVQHLTGASRRFEILAGKVPQTEIQTISGRGLFGYIRVTFELIADCRSNEIGAIRVEAFLHHQVDVTEVDKTKIDRDFFAVSGLWSEFADITGHTVTILAPSGWMVYGWQMAPVKYTAPYQEPIWPRTGSGQTEVLGPSKLGPV